MRRKKVDDSEATTKVSGSRRRKATSPEARINQLVALSFDLVERQLIEGTASATVIAQILKMGSLKEELEIQKLKSDARLSEAKASSLEEERRAEIDYQAVISELKKYRGED